MNCIFRVSILNCIFRVSAEIVAINDKGESAPFQVELDTPQPNNLQETSSSSLNSKL